MADFSERYGPWAVVTGAAQGVGLAFTEALVARGCGVVMLDRQPSVVEVAAAVAGPTRAVVADLADRSWIAALDEATADVEVGLAVANAAVSYVGPFLNQPEDSRAASVVVNCLATTELAGWALPPMVRRGRGGFVVTSSGSALAGTGSVATYSASKAYVLNLAEAVGWELRGTGVDALAVVAPAMDTPGWRSHAVDQDHVAVAPVDPRPVVERALDHLPVGGWLLAGEGLDAVAALDRGARVELLSDVTSAMYPHEYPR